MPDACAGDMADRFTLAVPLLGGAGPPSCLSSCATNREPAPACLNCSGGQELRGSPHPGIIRLLCNRLTGLLYSARKKRSPAPGWVGIPPGSIISAPEPAKLLAHLTDVNYGERASNKNDEKSGSLSVQDPSADKIPGIRAFFCPKRASLCALLKSFGRNPLDAARRSGGTA